MSKPRWSDGTVMPAADILRISRKMMDQTPRPPMTTDDALRQIAHTGSDDAKRLARAELRRRRGR